MTDCAGYRRLLLADPRTASADVREHLRSCPECTAYSEQLRRFDARLEQALGVDVDAAVPRRSTVVPLRARRRAVTAVTATSATPAQRRGWQAAAASVVLGLIIAGGLWIAAPHTSLAADVVTHMAGEPGAWARTDTPVAGSALESVLQQSGIRLQAGAGLVTYASSCEFRGHRVPHLVVQTAVGPVTVMMLTREAVGSAQRFHDDGYQGVILPVPGHGSLAVLERSATYDQSVLQSVAARVMAAVDYSSSP